MTSDPQEPVEFFKKLDSEENQYCLEMKHDNMTKVTKADEAEIYRHYVAEEQRIHRLRCDGRVGYIEVIIPEVLL